MEDGLNVSQGIGEGQAQVFRPADLSYLDRAIQQQNYDKRAKRAEQKQRQGEFNKGLSSLHDLDIFHADQPYFAQQSQDLYDWAKAGNAEKIIKGGDANALMDFQKMVADYQTEANLSKAKDKEVAELGTALKSKTDEYSPESQAYYESLNQRFAGKKGEKPNWFVDKSKVQKQMSDKDILNYAQDLKGKNIEGGSYRKDPKTGQNVNYTFEYYPREAADKIVERTLSDPRIYSKYASRLSGLKDPAEKLLYTDKDGKLDVVKFAQDQLAPSLVKGYEQKATASGGGGGLEINFGAGGEVTTGKYRFVPQTKEEVVPIPDIANPKRTKTEKTKVIAIQDLEGGETKAFEYPDPNRQGYRKLLVPKEYRQKPDGSWVLVANPKEGGKNIEIPEKNITADMKAITGISLDEILKGQSSQEAQVQKKDAVPVKKNAKHYGL